MDEGRRSELRRVAAPNGAEDDPSTVPISRWALVIALLLVVMLVVVGLYGLADWMSGGNVGVTIRPP